MNNLKKIILWLGLIGCVMLWVIGLRNMIGGFQNMIGGFGPRTIVSIDTLITGVKKMNLLKPYRVVTAGFANEYASDGNEKAELVYQYKGMAEYSVDLSTVKCIKNNNDLELELCEPVLEKPIMLNLPNPMLWDVTNYPAFKKTKWEEWFKREEGRIVANRIRTDVDTEENREKAKEQTEVTLRYMFSPLIEDVSKIKFKWIK